MRKRSSGQVLAQHALDFGRLEALAIVQPVEQAVDNFLGFILAEVLDEAVEKVLAGHGVIDLGFLVMVLQFGKIHHAELAGIPSLAVDLEHHLVGLKQHEYYIYIGPERTSNARTIERDRAALPATGRDSQPHRRYLAAAMLASRAFTNLSVFGLLASHFGACGLLAISSAASATVRSTLAMFS